MKSHRIDQRPIRARWIRACGTILCLISVTLSGCVANIDQVLFVSATAAGRTVVDGWFTEVANLIAASLSGS